MIRRAQVQAPIAALVLAAGLSRRMAPDNKLLTTDAAGRPMIARVVEAVVASQAAPVLVVIGHQADRLATSLQAFPVTLVHAPDYASGMAASLRAGIEAVPADCAGAIICLGDMPLITCAMIDRIITAYDPVQQSLIIVPTHERARGNPVLWDRRFFSEICALHGDHGARRLIFHHTPYVSEIEIGSEAVLTDADTREALFATLSRT